MAYAVYEEIGNRPGTSVRGGFIEESLEEAIASEAAKRPKAFIAMGAPSELPTVTRKDSLTVVWSNNGNPH